MLDTLVFHIGDPKNGSSSIQQAMQSGACHCPTVSWLPQREMNASALANCLKPSKGDAVERAQTQAELFGEKAAWARNGTADLGVISAEFFSTVRPKVLLAALAEYLPDYADTTRIIAYVRPHAGRVLSGYGQRVKTGTFTGTLADFVVSLPDRSHLAYAPRFARWKDSFGDRFTLRPFLRGELRDGDVVADFFHQVLQGAAFTLDPVPSTNEALTLPELTAMRRVQDRFITAELPGFLRLSLGGALGRLLTDRDGRYPGKLALDRAAALRIRMEFLEDARALDAQFFDRPLMQQAIEGAVETAIPEAQSLEGTDYYPAAHLTQLEQLADDIARLVKQRPRAWRRDYQRRNGQRFDAASGGRDGRAQQKNAEQVWSLLGDLATGLQPVGQV